MKILFKNTLLLTALLFINNVSAVDGVIEINQTCAIQTGCFIGDGPGFPVTIGAPVLDHSYRLTSNLIFDSETIIILISKNFVMIDFNGFSIIRSDCLSVICSQGNGTGGTLKRGAVDANSTAFNNIHLKNGSIVGATLDGAHVGKDSIIENMRIVYSGRYGVASLESSIIRNSILSFNGSYGALVQDASNVYNNVFANNQDAGISCGSGTLIRNNSMYKNKEGIQASEGCKIASNTIYNNNFDGILVFADANTGAFIEDNVIFSNGGDGVDIFVGNRTTLKGNYISRNFGADVKGTFFNLGNNFCGANDTCP